MRVTAFTVCSTSGLVAVAVRATSPVTKGASEEEDREEEEAEGERKGLAGVSILVYHDLAAKPDAVIEVREEDQRRKRWTSRQRCIQLIVWALG